MSKQETHYDTAPHIDVGDRCIGYDGKRYVMSKDCHGIDSWKSENGTQHYALDYPRELVYKPKKAKKG